MGDVLPSSTDLARTLLARIQKIHLANPQIDEVFDFLRSPEAQKFFRQMLASKITGRYDDHRPVLREQLSAMTALQLDLDREPTSKLAEALYDTLEAAASSVTEHAARHDQHPVARELRRSAWFDQLQGGINQLSETTTWLRELAPQDFRDFLRFQEVYRGQVRQSMSSIVPPHLDQKRHVPINDIYVSPSFSPVAMKRSRKTRRGPARLYLAGRQGLQFADVAESTHRTVVLGNPGAGKSTFARKLCFDLTGPDGPPGWAMPARIPFLVILRDYATQWQEARMSIVDYLEQIIAGELSVEPPQGCLHYFLETGRALVVFDGLDELLDTSLRETVAGVVENFGSRYPDAPILVTSRRQGYEHAPLNPTIFDTYRLTDFSDEQVQEYVRKWFSLDSALQVRDRERVIASFLSESVAVRDIRSNPLMLGLLCNIYHGEGYIPRYRSEVYERCATLLFERWDRRRGIQVPLPFQAHVRPAVMHLAYTIYSEPALAGGMTRSRLVEQTVEYLMPDRFDDPDEARAAAEEFVEYCTGRAWIFTDTGSTTGEPLYEFTHRTFLEYFASLYLVRTSGTPAALWRILRPRLESSEWEMVAQLSLQKLEGNLEGAATAFLEKVLSASRQVGATSSLALLGFAARALHGVVPTPALARRIVNAVIDRAVSRSPVQAPGAIEGAGQLMGALTACAEDNRDIVARAVTARLSSVIKKGGGEAGLALTDLANLDLASELTTHYSLEDLASDPFVTQSQAAIIDLLGRGIEAARTVESDLALYRRGFISGQELISRHGLEAILQPLATLDVVEGPIWLSPLGDYLIVQYGWAREGVWDGLTVEKAELLAAVKNHALGNPAPVVVAQSAELHLGSWWREDPPGDIAPPPQDLIFPLWVIIATALEIATKIRKVRGSDVIQRMSLGALAFLAPIVRGRYEAASRGDSLEALSALGLPTEQASVIEQWIKRRVAFIQSPNSA